MVGEAGPGGHAARLQKMPFWNHLHFPVGEAARAVLLDIGKHFRSCFSLVHHSIKVESSLLRLITDNTVPEISSAVNGTLRQERVIWYPYMKRKKYPYIDRAHCISIWVLEAYIVIIIGYIVMLAMHSVGEREEQGWRVHDGGWLGWWTANSTLAIYEKQLSSQGVHSPDSCPLAWLMCSTEPCFKHMYTFFVQSSSNAGQETCRFISF